MANGDNTGLGLFDDKASAVGNFPSSLRGYDRSAVDDYVRTLESSVVQSRRHATELEQQVSALQEQLSSASAAAAEKSESDTEPDYSDLGGRATDILRLAQEQASELVANATVEAEKVKEQAHREADDVREHADRDGAAIKSGGAAEIDQLRTTLHQRVQDQIDQARAEGQAVLEAARRQADAVRREADHDAESARAKAGLDAEELRGTTDREIAERRTQLAADRERLTADLQTAYDDAQAKTAALLAESTQHHRESGERLEADITEAARIRAEATAEAEKVKLAAVEESEARIATAKKQAGAIGERTQQEFSWRKQQLKRETDLLHQRKQAVLSQLASLSALAQQTANAFPDLDGPDDSHDESAAPDELDPGPQFEAEGDEAVHDQARDDEGEVEMDGDATVLVNPADIPAGTEHLADQAPAEDEKASEDDSSS